MVTLPRSISLVVITKEFTLNNLQRKFRCIAFSVAELGFGENSPQCAHILQGEGRRHNVGSGFFSVFGVCALCVVGNGTITHVHQSAAIPPTYNDVLSQVFSEAPDDVEKIKHLFSCLFRFHELGFTLFGDKPLSFCLPYDASSLKLTPETNLYWHVRNTLAVSEAYSEEWQAWERLRPSLKIDAFSFIRDRELGIVLINRRTCLDVIARHRALFEATLGHSCEASAFVREIERGDGLFTLLHENHELLGILLGFGSHNSHLFQRRHEILEAIEPSRIPVQLHRDCLPSKGYASLEEELSALETKFGTQHITNAHLPLVSWARVVFAQDRTHPETETLRRKYDQQQEFLQSLVLREDWFEQILNRLTVSWH